MGINNAVQNLGFSTSLTKNPYDLACVVDARGTRRRCAGEGNLGDTVGPEPRSRGDRHAGSGGAGMTEPTDRAVLLLQRLSELRFESRAIAQQLEAEPPADAPSSYAAERVAYGILVAALEEGL